VLVTADSETGFKGVYRSGGKFKAQASRNGGKQMHLGYFGTPEAAALAYARHVGPERAAAAAAKTEAAEPELTAEQAKAQARAEGLALVRADTDSGFKGVTRERGWFKAQAREGGKGIRLGNFGTPEAAALVYARHVAAMPPAAPQPEPTGAEDDQPGDAEAAAPTPEPEGREILYEILYDLSDDSSSSDDDDDDDDEPAAAVEAASTAEAGTSTSAEAAPEASAEVEADASLVVQAVVSDASRDSVAPGTSNAARKRPAEQAPAAAAGSSDASKQARVATPPAREGLLQQTARIKSALKLSVEDICGIIGEADALMGLADEAAGRPLPEQAATLLQELGM